MVHSMTLLNKSVLYVRMKHESYEMANAFIVLKTKLTKEIMNAFIDAIPNKYGMDKSVKIRVLS